MRRWLIGAAAALSAGCASAALPPGGPEDHAPPRLVRVTPDTNAVNVTARVATFFFDETINDRGSGATEVGNYFLVSPSDGNAHISWHRSRIDVRPRLGFRANTTYSITLLPGLSDLRNNVMKSGGEVVFSTGPTIATQRITGIAFDWASERPAARALIQAVTPDSVIYLAQADSVGRFSIGPMPDGAYVVRAVIDANGNRALDRNEAFDSLRVVVPQQGTLELLAIVRDTLPPRLTTVAPVDSLSLRVTFDRALDPAALPSASAFTLAGPDSAFIGITAVRTPVQEADDVRLAAAARADSARKADSVAARSKPAAPATPATPSAVVPAVPAVPLPALPRAPASARPRADTAVVKPSRPAPPTSLLLRLALPLQPSTTYRLVATNVRALSGRASSSERRFTTPKPAPPPTLRPASDSVRRPVVLPRTLPAPGVSLPPAAARMRAPAPPASGVQARG